MGDRPRFLNQGFMFNLRKVKTKPTVTSHRVNSGRTNPKTHLFDTQKTALREFTVILVYSPLLTISHSNTE